MVTDILAGKNTIPAMEAELKENPNNDELLYKLGKKYSDRGESEIAENYFNQFIENSPESMDDEIISAKFSLAKFGWDNGEISKLQNFIDEYPNSDQCLSAYQYISRYYSTQNDTANEVNSLLEMAEKYPENSSALNSYAWRMTELNRNLDDALIKAKNGVKFADEDNKPMILDTQAEIEWMLGDVESAIKTIELAISLDSENEYYQEQLEKFKKE